ncbi:MAG: hypothetical protein HQK49_12890 [Oligoflexia bacterium]|nr:hypothetical protein [Oligoflexia bacterium]
MNQLSLRSKFILIACVAFLFLLFERMASSGVVSGFLHPTTKYATWAFSIGIISSASLILGSICGLIYSPRPTVTAALTAFGAGALLAALSIELIAPTVMGIVGQMPGTESAHLPSARPHAIYTMGALIIGCILGGVFFVVMDELINSKINSKENSSGAMGIWLGLLIDGIPESFVIGAGFLALLSAKLAAGHNPNITEIMPYTLIAGLFLSNFPEALSSSIGMKKQGMGALKILVLWGSMVLIISVGSVVGYYIGAEIPNEYEIGIEGVAAGAMLTMISQTMIPEAVHIGGSGVVGLSTLVGYLSAVAFKLLE